MKFAKGDKVRHKPDGRTGTVKNAEEHSSDPEYCLFVRWDNSNPASFGIVAACDCEHLNAKLTKEQQEENEDLWDKMANEDEE